jgi:phospholipid/cholesterol/gamma-HCH transport system substrate-binding protein
MTERVRNVAVGVTVILALCGLAGMIILFGKSPVYATGGYRLTVVLPASGGVGGNSSVQLNGFHVGTVTDVVLMSDPSQGVRVHCRIDHKYRIPDTASVSVGSRGLGGSAYVDLYASAPPPGHTTHFLPTDGKAELQGQISPYGGLLGSEMSTELGHIAASFQSFSRLADNLNAVLMGQAPPAPVTTQPATGSAPSTASAPTGGQGLATAIVKLNGVLDGMATIVNNPDNQTNIQVSLANLRKATEQATAAIEQLKDFAQEARSGLANVNRSAEAVTSTAQLTGQRVSELASQLGDDAARLGRLLTTLNQVSEKIVAGEGTAGKLLNDPALYNELVDSMRQLSKTLTELQATLKTWREKGVDVKVF